MKTIGLIGGMSWESTVTYYQIINEAVKNALGGLHSAKILLYSVDFQEIEACQSSGDWEKSARILSDAARKLERGGADFILICTNTMHKVAPEIARSVGIPIVHIADATADALRARNVTRAALLGTRYTMTQDFYRRKLEAAGIEVLVPGAEDVEKVDDVIFHELCLGVISKASKEALLRIIDDLAARGAQGVILGCTEIGLLIGQADTELPVFDTTQIHARRAAELALAGGGAGPDGRRADMRAKEMWERFRRECGAPDAPYAAWSFGGAPDALADLVLRGIKTATASAHALYEAENAPLPAVGDYSVILDSKGEAKCIVRTTRVYVTPFDEVGADHARLEGEGDRSLAHWRAVHEAFFRRELAEAGMTFDPKMKVVCEEFERVYQ